MAQFVEVDAKDLAKLHKALAAVDKVAARKLTSRLRAIAKPIAEDVKRAALAIPSTNEGRSQPGLRAGIAKAVDIKIGRPTRGAFVRIRVSGTKFEKATGRNRRLPRYMEGKMKGGRWRHPVWPDKGADRGSWDGVWAAQDTHPYLLPTVLRRRFQVAEELQDEYLDTFEAIFRAEGL